MGKSGRKSSDSQPELTEEQRSPAAGGTVPRFGVDTRLGSAPGVPLPSRPEEAEWPQEQSAESGHTWSNLADDLIAAINRSSHDSLPPVVPPEASEDGDGDDDEPDLSMDMYTVPSLPDIGDVADTLMFNKRAKVTADPEEPGDLIGGRYRPGEGLGDGGMARIFQAEHVSLGKQFALKVIQKEYWDDTQVREMFLREAVVASQLEHPNIVQVTDFGLDDQLGAYIVMELLKGQTLRAQINETRGMPISAVLDVMLQTASALHYMHNQNYVHCDVKSENVFLCRQPEGERQRHVVKLIDFGLSKAEALGAKLARSEVGGTPEYIAPEQIRGKAPQPSMDVYSLGVVFYEMLTGVLPFNGTAKELIQHHLKTPPPSVSEFMDEPPDEQVEQLIQQLLAKDPDKRPQSAGQVVYHLRTLADMLGLSHANTRRRQRTRTSPQKQTRELLELRAMVKHCPIPIFRVSTDGILQTGNRAFFEFVRMKAEQAVGMPLEETRLRIIFPEVADEIVTSAATGDTTPVVRTASFKHTAKPVSVKIMLMPESDDNGDIHHFTGIIHSLNPE